MPGGIHPPVEVMLSWPTPNYDDPVTRSKAVLIIACIFGPLTLSLLLARLWVRIRLQRNAGWDDWLMVAATVPIIFLTVLIPFMTEVYFFNRHVWDVSPTKFVLQRKFVLILETVFCVAAGLIKVSILLFYRRLSSRAISTTFRWATWISIGFIIGFSIVFFLIPILGCRPISAFWDQLDIVKEAEGYNYKCYNEGADVFAAAVISAFQDLITAIFPTFLYWKLQLPLRQKIALFGIFAIGYGVVVIGSVRAYYSWHVFFQTYDVTWTGWQNFLWALLELHIGAMCANAPALRVFFKHFRQADKLFAHSKSRSNGSRRDSSAKITTSSKSGTLIFEKLAFWKHNRSHRKNGYLNEPHSDVSTDMHGGVRIQKEVHIHRSTLPSRKRDIMDSDSVDILASNARFDEDIEMGSWKMDTRDWDSTVES